MDGITTDERDIISKTRKKLYSELYSIILSRSTKFSKNFTDAGVRFGTICNVVTYSYVSFV